MYDTLTLSVREAAQWLGVSVCTAYRMIHQGVLPTIRLSRVLRVPTQALRALVAGKEAA